MLRLAFVSLAFAGACVTPELPDPPAEGPDAAPPIDAPPPDAPDGCELRITNVGTGHHNPGTDCLSCHQGQDPLAPYLSIGGTAYKDAEGTEPIAGATVIVIDGNGNVIKLPTMQNGNFYTSVTLTPPFSTGITMCPDTIPMITNFTDGDCNSCHRATGSPGRVWLD